LIQFPKRVSKVLGRTISFTEKVMSDILLAYKEGYLAKEGILPSLLRFAYGHEFERHGSPGVSKEEFDAELARSIKELKGMKIRHGDKTSEIMMGLIMSRVRGRMDGKLVSEKISGIRQEDLR
jgi:Glu-tRNA(Gln) amidotransferase subunit E-like FAD-binding protein